MTIIYSKGNLLEGTEKYIVHGCNARGTMGSGVALQIKRKYPHTFRGYRKAYEGNMDSLQVGSVIVVQNPDGKIVFNCITQKYYGRSKDVVYVEYDAIRTCLLQVNKWVGTKGFLEVAMPKIGCGLANGDWDIVEQIINDTMVDCQPIVYTL